MSRTLALVIIVVIALAPLAGAAPVPEFDREEPIITAAYKMGQTAWKSGSSITLITSEEIKRSHARYVSEVLRGIPGITIINAGGRGRGTEIRMRGSAPDKTLVMIDGMRVHNNESGYAELDHLTLDNIDRIEVVRGQQGAIWGADAVGGVIHIYTSKGSENRSAFQVEGGSEATGMTSFSTSTSNENHKMSVGGSWMATEGFSAANRKRGNFEKDGSRTRSLNMNYGTQIGRFGVGLSLLYLDGTSDIDGDGPVDDQHFYQKNRDLGASLSITRRIGSRWIHTAQFTSFEDEEQRDTGAYARFVSTTKSAEWRGLYEYDEKSRMLFGIRSEKRGGKNEGQFDRDNTNNSIYAQILHSPQKRLDLSIAARYDRGSLFGDQNTLRGTGVYKHSNTLRFFGSYGTSYRAPTNQENFHPRFGNLYLQPVESKGWDAGIEHLLLERVFVKLGYFHNELESNITFVAPTNIAGNIGSERAKGWEATASWKLTDQFRVDANYTRVDTNDKATQLDLKRQPKNSGKVTLSYQPAAHVGIDAVYEYAGSNYGSPNQQDYVRNYGTLSGVVNYDLDDNHSFWMRVNNLTNNRFEEVLGYGTQEFSMRAGYEYSFKEAPQTSNAPAAMPVAASQAATEEYDNIPIDVYHGDDYELMEGFLSSAKYEFEEGNFRKAIAIYRQAEEINPRSFRIKYNLGTVHYSLKEYPEALEKYKQARNIRPDDINALLFVGFCYYHMNERGAAIDAWRQVLEYDPDNTLATRNLQMLRAMW